MATNVLLPQWGMNMEDGLLVRWLVQEGDTVEAGQPLVEIETAKIESELESPVAGMVAHIMAKEGTTVDVGTIVAVLGAPGEEVARPTETKPQRRAGSARRRPSGDGTGASRAGGVQVTPVARRLARQENVDLAVVTGTGPNGRITEDDVRRAMESSKPGTAVQVVPRARHLARENGIDLAQVQGSGPNGRIVVADVERAMAAQASAAASEIVPLTGLRKTIATRMADSARTTAPVTLTTEADVTELVGLRERLVSAWRPHRVRPLEIDLIVKATARALSEHPRLNATLVDGEIRLMEQINIGVAMAVPDGLMVPVVDGADRKDALAIAGQIRDYARRSRDGDLSVDDVTGATFTITSLSNYEIDAFTPIIDAPQVAILGVGRIVEKPAVHKGEVAVRSMMYLSLTFDHRALDGVPAGEFLGSVKARLEDPGWMGPDGAEG
jgi:pyruvate dehydrogenase E2 component (dihydrolipoamide acetyltransferase)